MKFEVKKYYKVGDIKTKSDSIISQFINITVGVYKCPHEDINTEKTVECELSSDLSFKQIDEEIDMFVKNWISLNYPDVENETDK